MPQKKRFLQLERRSFNAIVVQLSVLRSQRTSLPTLLHPSVYPSLELELDWEGDLSQPSVPRDLCPATDFAVHLVTLVRPRVELLLRFLHLEKNKKEEEIPEREG